MKAKFDAVQAYVELQRILRTKRGWTTKEWNRHMNRMEAVEAQVKGKDLGRLVDLLETLPPNTNLAKKFHQEKRERRS